MTSGASELPPMPASTMWVRPSATSSVAQRLDLGDQRPGGLGQASAQDSRIADSDSASGPHRVGFCSVMPLATWSATSASTASAKPASSA